MRLHEYRAKEIFKKRGIPIPKGIVVNNPSEAAGLFQKLGPCVIKAQVLVGGRGKAGGIKIASNQEELNLAVKKILGSEIKGLKVDRLLIEEKKDIECELYLGVTVDKSKAKAAVILSAKGGVDIEEIAKEFPQEIIKREIDIRRGLILSQAIEMASNLKLRSELQKEIGFILLNLYQVFLECDAEIAEINPLALTIDEKIVALDAVLTICDEALFRHPELSWEDESLTELERRARKYRLGYVKMNGDIGVIGNGAGLNLATLDILKYYGGEPANFLEVSGRTYWLADIALDIVLSNPRVKVVFGNFLGCISRCDKIAEGLAKAIREKKIKVPMVIAMRGNGADIGVKILKDLGLEVYQDDELAGKKVVELAKRMG